MLEKLNIDLVNAMKEKDKVKMATLRGVKGALQLEVINKKCEENDELLLDVINKQIKMRNDSIKEFEKANRQDLIKSYQEEIDILNAYMPQQLTIEELDKIINDAFDKVKPESNKDMGKIMKEVLPQVKNRCDMTELNKKIKEKLEA